ncbi:MAG: LysE family translocator [Candidatus Bathyarchaeota archaeon]|nr:LysE family translocator [Candidatus Bathyarchaeota archaeon]
MDVLNFVATIVLVTASGALAPGPLFFAAISHGAKLGARGGLAFAVGHTLFEFPLIVLIALGLNNIVSEPAVKLSTGVIGGLALIVFGVMQIHNCLTSRFGVTKSRATMFQNPILIGLGFTGLNPFFVVWWFTAGLKLIDDSSTFLGLLGVLFMYICHVWMDYAWLTAVAHSARVGINMIGARWYRAMMVFFGVVLICFGTIFLVSALWVL